MKIIGLTGFAKSGKSTAAEILKEMGGQEVAFAKHLKDVCSVAFDVRRDWFDDQNFKETQFENPEFLTDTRIEQILHYFEIPQRYVPQAIISHFGKELTSARHIAQYVGTELLRGINQNIHIETAFKMAPPGTKFLICSDVRFANELQAVNERDGIVIGISRKKATPADLVNLHPSEKEVPELIEKADFKVENETSIEDFQAEIKRIVDLYLTK